jgi:hypothetical protein
MKTINHYQFGRQFQHLATVDLSRQCITDEKFREFSLAIRSFRIQVLNLQHNQISDQSMIAFVSVFRSLSALRSLNLSYNLITDYSVKLLSDVNTYSSSLEELNLSYNKLTSISAYYLSFYYQENYQSRLRKLILGGKLSYLSTEFWGNEFLKLFVGSLLSDQSNQIHLIEELYLNSFSLDEEGYNYLLLLLMANNNRIHILNISNNYIFNESYRKYFIQLVQFLVYRKLSPNDAFKSAIKFSIIQDDHSNSTKTIQRVHDNNNSSNDMKSVKTTTTSVQQDESSSYSQRKSSPSTFQLLAYDCGFTLEEIKYFQDIFIQSEIKLKNEQEKQDLLRDDLQNPIKAIAADKIFSLQSLPMISWKSFLVLGNTLYSMLYHALFTSYQVRMSVLNTWNLSGPMKYRPPLIETHYRPQLPSHPPPDKNNSTKVGGGGVVSTKPGTADNSINNNNDIRPPSSQANQKPKTPQTPQLSHRLQPLSHHQQQLHHNTSNDQQSLRSLRSGSRDSSFDGGDGGEDDNNNNLLFLLDEPTIPGHRKKPQTSMMLNTLSNRLVEESGSETTSVTKSITKPVASSPAKLLNKSEKIDKASVKLQKQREEDDVKEQTFIYQNDSSLLASLQKRLITAIQQEELQKQIQQQQQQPQPTVSSTKSYRSPNNNNNNPSQQQPVTMGTIRMNLQYFFIKNKNDPFFFLLKNRMLFLNDELNIIHFYQEIIGQLKSVEFQFQFFRSRKELNELFENLEKYNSILTTDFISQILQEKQFRGSSRKSQRLSQLQKSSATASKQSSSQYSLKSGSSTSSLATVGNDSSPVEEFSDPNQVYSQEVITKQIDFFLQIQWKARHCLQIWNNSIDVCLNCLEEIFLKLYHQTAAELVLPPPPSSAGSPKRNKHVYIPLGAAVKSPKTQRKQAQSMIVPPSYMKESQLSSYLTNEETEQLFFCMEDCYSQSIRKGMIDQEYVGCLYHQNIIFHYISEKKKIVKDFEEREREKRKLEREKELLEMRRKQRKEGRSSSANPSIAGSTDSQFDKGKGSKLKPDTVKEDATGSDDDSDTEKEKKKANKSTKSALSKGSKNLHDAKKTLEEDEKKIEFLSYSFYHYLHNTLNINFEENLFYLSYFFHYYCFVYQKEKYHL